MNCVVAKLQIGVFVGDGSKPFLKLILSAGAGLEPAPTFFYLSFATYDDSFLYY